MLGSMSMYKRFFTSPDHQNFYYFDAGVYYSLKPRNLYNIETEKEGPASEGLVAQHLKAWIEFQKEPHQLFYWRTTSKVEVDFIVTGPSCFAAIEVKNGTTIHPGDLRGLQTFCEDYPEATAIFLYRGNIASGRKISSVFPSNNIYYSCFQIVLWLFSSEPLLRPF